MTDVLFILAFVAILALWYAGSKMRHAIIVLEQRTFDMAQSAPSATTVEHKYATVAGAISAEVDLSMLAHVRENWDTEEQAEFGDALDSIWRGRSMAATCATRPLLYRVGDYTTAMRNVQVGWLGGGS